MKKAVGTRMKAVEIRSEIINAQYAVVISEIENARRQGETSIRFEGDSVLDPKVIEKLAKEDCFDVVCVKGFMSVISYTQISWENAEEGRIGKIKHVTTKDLVREYGLPALANLKKGAEVLGSEIKVHGSAVLEELKKQKDKLIYKDMPEETISDEECCEYEEDEIPNECECEEIEEPVDVEDEEAEEPISSEAEPEEIEGPVFYEEELEPEEVEEPVSNETKAEDAEECDAKSEAEKAASAKCVQYAQGLVKEAEECVENIKELLGSRGDDFLVKVIEQSNSILGKVIERSNSFINDLNEYKDTIVKGDKPEKHGPAKDDSKKPKS